MWTITASAAVDSVLLFAASSESLARLLLAPLVAAAAAVGVRALYAAPGITSISEALPTARVKRSKKAERESAAVFAS